MTDTPLQPTPRTRLTREKDRAVAERSDLVAFLRESLVAHVGVVADSHPVVLPSAYAIDLDGPDEGGTLYLHGSVGAGWLRLAPGAEVCVTVTELDGLVLARSGFNHSVNYRSAVVIGIARRVEEPAERNHALDLIVDHIVPGRAATLRPPTKKELAATVVLAVPLVEASMKTRTGGVHDEPSDVAAGAWAGVLALHRVAGELEPDPDNREPLPPTVAARADALRTP